jgi:Ca-activated chloride channel homolog
MNRRLAIQSLMAASAGSFLDRLRAASPQDDKPGGAEGGYVLRSEVRLVLLDVSVKDSKGGFVSGLSMVNFTVLEDGRPQSIKVFANDDVPVTVGILVDASRSMTPKRGQVLAAADVFIGESNPLDEVFILHFNDWVKRGLPPDVLFSDDLQQLRLALSQGIPEGKTALNDAVVAGLEQLQLGHRDKKTLVLISDGGDNASKHNRQEMLNLVEKSAATIYTIGLFEPDDPDKDPVILRKLAKISGGEAYLPSDPSEMGSVCRRIAKDIRTRYTIGYAPPASVSSGKGSLRHIKVRASSPGHGDLLVRTRMSYRYEEIEGSRKK